MRGPREVLNELKWREGALASARVHYVHRGAPGDARVVSGERITDLGHSFFTLVERGRETSIPYHRVFVVEVDGRVVWERRGHGREGVAGESF